MRQQNLLAFLLLCLFVAHRPSRSIVFNSRFVCNAQQSPQLHSFHAFTSRFSGYTGVGVSHASLNAPDQRKDSALGHKTSATVDSS
jgi:hypothetical protein